jgi:hypothetical protein
MPGLFAFRQAITGSDWGNAHKPAKHIEETARSASSVEPNEDPENSASPASDPERKAIYPTSASVLFGVSRSC